MKINIISCFILLSFVSISVAVEPTLEANLEQTFEPGLAEYLRRTNRPTLDANLLNKQLKEIETDESDDDRPQEIQDLEQTFEDGLDTFIKERSQDFQDVVSGLVKAISKSVEANTNQGKPIFFRKIKEFLSSSTGDNFGHLLAKEFATVFGNFKEYFESIIGLNSGLMDQLKKVSKKISTVSFVKPLEPEEEIGMLSIGSSSTFDHNNMEDIKKLLIDIISQAMTCRFKVVYTINWIRVVLDELQNKAKWMQLRQDLVELKQKYNAIEMNLNECLKTFNEMISNPDKRDDSNVKLFKNYFEETIEEGKFISKTKEIIKKIERLDMKPGSGRSTHIYNELFSEARELLLTYLGECQQEMKDNLRLTDTASTRNRMRRSREIKKEIDRELKKPQYQNTDVSYTEGRKFRRIIYDENKTEQISFIIEKLLELQMDNNLIEKFLVDITSDTNQIKRIIWYLLNNDNIYYHIRIKQKLMIMDIIGYDDDLYRLEHIGYEESLKQMEQEVHGYNVYDLEREMNTIRYTLSSSNVYEVMVAKTIKAIGTLMKKPIIKDFDLSEPLETFKQKMLKIKKIMFCSRTRT